MRYLSLNLSFFFDNLQRHFCNIYLCLIICYRYADDKIRITRGYNKIMFVHLRVDKS